MKPYLYSALAVLTLSLNAAAQPEPAQRTPKTAAELERELASLTGRPGGLTSEEVARRARSTSPSLRAKRAQVAAADAERERAAAGFLPRVTLTGRYTRLSPIDAPSLGPSGVNLVVTPAGEGPLPPGAPLVGVPASALSFPVILDQYLLQANLTVPISDYVLRTGRTYAAASHSKKAAELSERAQRSSVAANAKLAYYAWARARLHQVVAQQTEKQAKAQLEAAQELAAVDRASRADVLAAEAQLAGAELLVDRAQHQAEVTEDRLRTLMHDTGTAPLRIGEDLFAQAPRSRPRPALRELLRVAERNRLELRALDHTAWSLREQKQAARSASYPRLDAFGNAYYANPNPRYVPQEEKWRASWDVGVQLTWTPNDVVLSSASSAAVEARRAEVEAQKAELRDALRSEVFESRQALLESEAALATSERRLIAAEEAYRVRAERFRFGRATQVELTEAEAELLRARLERIDARIGVKTSTVRLDHALGRDGARR